MGAAAPATLCVLPPARPPMAQSQGPGGCGVAAGDVGGRGFCAAASQDAKGEGLGTSLCSARSECCRAVHPQGVPATDLRNPAWALPPLPRPAVCCGGGCSCWRPSPVRPFPSPCAYCCPPCPLLHLHWQYTMWARWRTAPSSTPAGTVATPSPSPWDRVSALFLPSLHHPRPHHPPLHHSQALDPGVLPCPSMATALRQLAPAALCSAVRRPASCGVAPLPLPVAGCAACPILWC